MARIRCPHCQRTFAAPTTQQAKGGRARAANLDPETRREIARKAARARWARRFAPLALAMVTLYGCGGSAPTGPTSAQVTHNPALLSGQSNAVNLAPFLQAAYPPGVVSIGEGSTPIAAWSPTGALWARLLPMLPHQYAAFVWWQGESDPATASYLADLRDLVSRVRAQSQQPRLRVIVVRVLNYPELAEVRRDEAMFAQTDGNAEMVSADLYQQAGPTNYHLTPDGYTAIAALIAARLP